MKKKYTLWFHESINVTPLQSILKMNHPWYPSNIYFWLLTTVVMVADDGR